MADDNLTVVQQERLSRIVHAVYQLQNGVSAFDYHASERQPVAVHAAPVDAFIGLDISHMVSTADASGDMCTPRHVIPTAPVLHYPLRDDLRTYYAFDALVAFAEALIQPPLPIVADEIGGDQRVRHLFALMRSLLGCENIVFLKMSDGGQLDLVDLTSGSDAPLPAWGQPYTNYLHEHPEYVADLIRLSINKPLVLDRRKHRWMRNTAPLHALSLSLNGACFGIIVLERRGRFTAAEQHIMRGLERLMTLWMDHKRSQQTETANHARALALHEAHQRMGAFLNVASHELRTPLTSIKGYAQLAIRRLHRLLALDNEEDRDKVGASLIVMLEAIDEQTTILNGLISDMLTASRGGPGHALELHRERCDLGTITQASVTTQHRAWPMRVINYESDDATHSVLADPRRIGQVVTNFITNALKYSTTNTPIHVSLRAEGSVLRVAVRDHGRGIPAEDQDFIWNGFYRVGTSANDLLTGAEIGLYLSRLIIEEHGGVIGVTTTSGGGATFWFTLPC